MKVSCSAVELSQVKFLFTHAWLDMILSQGRCRALKSALGLAASVGGILALQITRANLRHAHHVHLALPEHDFLLFGSCTGTFQKALLLWRLTASSAAVRLPQPAGEAAMAQHYSQCSNNRSFMSCTLHRIHYLAGPALLRACWVHGRQRGCFSVPLGFGRGCLVAQRHVDQVAEEDEPAYEHHRLPGPVLRVLLREGGTRSGCCLFDLAGVISPPGKGGLHHCLMVLARSQAAHKQFAPQQKSMYISKRAFTGPPSAACTLLRGLYKFPTPNHLRTACDSPCYSTAISQEMPSPTCRWSLACRPPGGMIVQAGLLEGFGGFGMPEQSHSVRPWYSTFSNRSYPAAQVQLTAETWSKLSVVHMQEVLTRTTPVNCSPLRQAQQLQPTNHTLLSPGSQRAAYVARPEADSTHNMLHDGHNLCGTRQTVLSLGHCPESLMKDCLP